MSKKQTPQAPLLEWLSAAIGLALLLGLLGVIGWEALHGGPSEAPAIEVTVREVARSPGGYVVEFDAFNRAGGTAQSVEIEGKLTGAGPAETSSITLDYVPGHSRRSGGLFFRQDPRRGSLALRALGYQEP